MIRRAPPWISLAVHFNKARSSAVSDSSRYPGAGRARVPSRQPDRWQPLPNPVASRSLPIALVMITGTDQPRNQPVPHHIDAGPIQSTVHEGGKPGSLRKSLGQVIGCSCPAQFDDSAYIYMASCRTPLPPIRPTGSPLRRQAGFAGFHANCGQLLYLDTRLGWSAARLGRCTADRYAVISGTQVTSLPSAAHLRLRTFW